MVEYHVKYGIFSIYAGTMRNKSEWLNKSECTDEAIRAVRDYMLFEILGGVKGNINTGGYEWKLKDGRTVELRISIKENNNG